MKGNLTQVIKDTFTYRFNLDEDKAREDEIIESLTRNVEFKGTNLWALIFAIFIASIGLNVNSTAVIIGAMLISPLMGPIMGIGLGAGIFDFKLIKFSLKNLFIAVVISLMTSALYFWLSPIHNAQSELLARTTPTVWDVLIALFGGLAGIIASSRKNISNAIPGVAIATALMPPLCTAGYGIGTGNFYYFIGAFYLFVINSVFISIATFLIVRFLKFKPVDFVDVSTEVKVRKYIWTIALLTILPSCYLAYRFVNQEIFRQNVQRFVRDEIDGNNLYVINQKIDAPERKVTLLVYGETLDDSILKAAEKQKKFYGLENADIKIRPAIGKGDLPEELERERLDYDRQLTRMMEKDNRIRALESKLNKYQNKDSTFHNEFQALFGNAKELSLSKSLLYETSGKTDSALVLYVKPEKKIRNKAQIKSWLMARYKIKQVRIVTD